MSDDAKVSQLAKQICHLLLLTCVEAASHDWCAFRRLAREEAFSCQVCVAPLLFAAVICNMLQRQSVA